MRRRLLVTPVLASLALLLPSAHAASTALVISDATGDANFSGLHGQSLPAGLPGFDIASVTFDTTKAITYKIVKKKKVKVVTPTGLQITLTMTAAPSTVPGSSYGVTADHSLCGALRLQIYYSESGAQTYGDLASCGSNTDPTSTNPEQAVVAFTPKVDGNKLVITVPFKTLPKQVKVGTLIDNITAYTSTAEFVVAGYQPTDFEPSAGVDIATATTPWKIA
jgi:hypothetical protein